MTDIKQQVIGNVCYTDLVYKRINKKLSTDLSNRQIELYIEGILINTDESFYEKTGKNYYVSNIEYNIRITINSNTYRVITVNRIEK